MFASGVPTAEKPQAKRYFLLSHGVDAKEEHANAWKRYKEYLRTTSILVPIPPAIFILTSPSLSTIRLLEMKSL